MQHSQAYACVSLCHRLVDTSRNTQTAPIKNASDGLSPWSLCMLMSLQRPTGQSEPVDLLEKVFPHKRFQHTRPESRGRALESNILSWFQLCTRLLVKEEQFFRIYTSKRVQGNQITETTRPLFPDTRGEKKRRNKGSNKWARSDHMWTSPVRFMTCIYTLRLLLCDISFYDHIKMLQYVANAQSNVTFQTRHSLLYHAAWFSNLPCCSYLNV